jgi:DNA-binding NtrC family response regulator
MELLARHRWPGNIRELRNVLEQAALMTDDLVLGARHLALEAAPASPGPAPAEPAVQALAPAAANAAGPARKPLPQAIAELEMRAIREALSATGGNKLAAAKLLGISRATLYDKLGAADDAAQ